MTKISISTVNMTVLAAVFLMSGNNAALSADMPESWRSSEHRAVHNPCEMPANIGIFERQAWKRNNPHCSRSAQKRLRDRPGANRDTNRDPGTNVAGRGPSPGPASTAGGDPSPGPSTTSSREPRECNCRVPDQAGLDRIRDIVNGVTNDANNSAGNNARNRGRNNGRNAERIGP